MSASYGILQRLIHPRGSRFTQKSSISPFNTGGCGRGGCRRIRGHGGRGYGHSHGGRGGCGGRLYVHYPDELSSRYGTFMVDACVYPSDQWRLLYLQQNNHIQ